MTKTAGNGSSTCCGTTGPPRADSAGSFYKSTVPEKRRLVGEASLIFSGTELGLVEGPHLYRRDGFYYLVTAEGGTFTTHAVSVARSTRLRGPYEVMPGNPLLTSARDPSLPLQSAGHGSLVQTQEGEWVMAHLCRRPLANGRSILGRETALQAVEWTPDGWPRLKTRRTGPVRWSSLALSFPPTHGNKSLRVMSSMVRLSAQAGSLSAFRWMTRS